MGLDVPHQPAEREGQRRAAMAQDQFRAGVFEHMARKQDPRYGHRGIRQPADRIDHVVIHDARVAGHIHRVDIKYGPALMRRRPEGLKRRVVEHAGIAVRLRADHEAAKAVVERLAEHLGSMLAVLEWHAGQRNQAFLAFAGPPERLVAEAVPVRPGPAFQLVAEAVGPGRDHLTVEALFVHPGEALFGFAQLRVDRPRRVPSCEGQAEAPVLMQAFDPVEAGRAPGERVEHRLGNVMGMRVDDLHRDTPFVNRDEAHHCRSVRQCQE